VTRRWVAPPWHQTAALRIKFLRELAGLRGLHLCRSPIKGGAFSFTFTVAPPGVPQRKVTVSFRRDVPHVFVDGPAESPHRYPDGSLCMWYPNDPPEMKWTLSDGAGVLVANIAAHLIKEEWWRMTGDWPGPEVHHRPADPSNDPKSADPRHDLPKRIAS
jgi:hypothetical protein